MADRERMPLNDADSIKSLEAQANNTRHLVDRINRAMYGMTWEEHTRLLCGKEKENEQD